VDIHLLIAMPDPKSQDLMLSLLNAASHLLPFKVEAHQARSRDELILQVREKTDDVVFLDWQLAEANTPDLARELDRLNPWLRVIVLLPLKLRQYRQCLWETGICSCMPKENLDHEWLCSTLCLIHQAMLRESRLASRT